MMKISLQYILAAVVIMMVAFTSCKGRYADATPNGETVEVKKAPVLAEPSSDLEIAPAAETGAPVKMEVKVVTPVRTDENNK